MTEADLERIAGVVTQEVMRTWNGAPPGDYYHSFRDSWLRTPEGRRVLAAATKLLRRCLEQEAVEIIP